ncbi:aldehyde dehydrogenase (NADP(+)) [Streptomyces kaempferi]
MTLTGHLLIGSSNVPASASTMKALDPATGEYIGPEFAFGGPAEVDRAARLADDAFDSYNRTGPKERAAFLDLIADRLDGINQELAERAALETGLPVAQLQGEAAKAASQFRQFADVVRAGRFRDAAIDPAQPERQPRPRMDHRLQKIAIGPVAIFGASNFPISYSVAAATPPPRWQRAPRSSSRPTTPTRAPRAPGARHPRRGHRLRAARGVFSMVRGAGNEIGEALVDHPLIKAVTFTGSERGGMALYRRAQLRPDPIPVFAEMTSVNPTFVLPAALAARGAETGDGFAERMLVNVGQACLKPAVLLAVDGPGYAGMREAAAARVNAMDARTMLTPGIHDAYDQGARRLRESGADTLTEGPEPQGPWEGRSRLLEVDGERFLADPGLAEEVFGPAALLVRLTDMAQLLEVARTFRGQLSATMHLDEADHGDAALLLPILERRTGRIVVNAFAHPQEVGDATIHGGPFPATTDSRFTSVGMTSIDRFLRPVTYQGFPDALLPDTLAADNPLGLPRLVDGHVTRD